MYGLLLFFQFVKSLQNIWNICFITLLLHPQSREIAFAEVLKNNFKKLSKTFGSKDKKLLPLHPQSKTRLLKKIKKEFFENNYISTSSTRALEV